MKNAVFWDAKPQFVPHRRHVSEERISSIIRVTRTVKLGTLAVTSNRSTVQRNGLGSGKERDKPFVLGPPEQIPLEDGHRIPFPKQRNGLTLR
jgi:hypothetical protein